MSGRVQGLLGEDNNRVRNGWNNIVSIQSATMPDPKASDANGEVAWETPVSRRGTPTWEMALNYPHQGEWTEEEYLDLDTNRLVEFTDGVLEFLPMPKPSHARLSRYISDLLRAHVLSKNLGDVFWAPFSVRVGPKKLREPDVMYLRHERIPEDDVPPVGADLVIEIVSGGSRHRNRDYQEKRADYAQAGIPEYWIVDPATETFTVLTLNGAEYELLGEFGRGAIATSAVLPGFEVNVGDAFTVARKTH